MKEDYKVELTNEISVERKNGRLYVTVEVETESEAQELLNVVNEEVRFCEICGKARRNRNESRIYGNGKWVYV